MKNGSTFAALLQSCSSNGGYALQLLCAIFSVTEVGNLSSALRTRGVMYAISWVDKDLDKQLCIDVASIFGPRL